MQAVAGGMFIALASQLLAFTIWLVWIRNHKSWLPRDKQCDDAANEMIMFYATMGCLNLAGTY